MKKNYFRLICAIICLCMLCPAIAGCASVNPNETEPSETKPVTNPDYSPMLGAAVEYLTAREFSSDRVPEKISDEFRTATADFALGLLNASRSVYDGDALLVSPLSALIALAMTANGAEGDTLSEMENVLGGGMSIEEINEQLFNYASSLKSTDDAKFNLANAIWVTSNPSFSINRNFVKAIENTYDADIIAADLPSSVGAINDWAKEETFGMIPSILKDGDLTVDTVMVLLNALAFDALWEAPVSESAVFESTFTGIDNNIQTAKFMRTSCDGYIEGENAVGIVKNYKGGNYAFVAILPSTNVYDYAASLDGEDFIELYDNRKKASSGLEVDAKMPNFSFDCNIEMKDALQSMGITKAFDSSQADLDGLGQDTRGGLFVSRVVQKTHIDLDHSGTRAAAVTAVMVDIECAPMEYYNVNLDRPFLYAIVDTEAGLPIFIGICDNIEQN